MKAGFRIETPPFTITELGTKEASQVQAGLDTLYKNKLESIIKYEGSAAAGESSE